MSKIFNGSLISRLISSAAIYNRRPTRKRRIEGARREGETHEIGRRALVGSLGTILSRGARITSLTLDRTHFIARTLRVLPTARPLDIRAYGVFICRSPVSTSIRFVDAQCFDKTKRLIFLHKHQDAFAFCEDSSSSS